jgi:hypothetical protein
MDGLTFDTLVRKVTTAASRRSVLKSALVPAFAGLGVASRAGVDEADAKKKRKKKKCKPKASGAPCSKDKQCCTKKTKRICDVPTGAGNSDTVCCGGNGAKCGGVDDEGNALEPFCCIGEAGVRSFVCSENDESNPNVPGVCQPAPEE